MEVSFKTYRVVKKGEYNYIQYPFTLFGIDLKWYYARTKYNNMNDVTMWFALFILIPLCTYIPFFLYPLLWLKILGGILIGLSALMTITLLASNYSDENPKWVSSDHSLKRDLYSINYEIQKNKEEEKTEIVGFYENGEYVEGTRLKRIKKLERIIKQ